MPSIKIATWNVNSLRVRLPHLTAWLNEVKPDICAIQETKLLDEHFPLETFKALGYQAIFAGQKAYNGVAILCRTHAPLHIMTDLPTLCDPQRRLLAAHIGMIRILNIYVPNGSSLGSDKYQYKLNWLMNFRELLKQELLNHQHVIVLGDFNIAPAEIDVHDPLQWAGRVLFSDREREALQELLNLGVYDCFRVKNPNEKQFSWWDYRLNSFKRNLGLRIDHILARSSLLNRCEACYIDKMPRGLERPSDHAPVIAEFLLD